MRLIRKPIKDLKPQDLIGVRDIRNTDAKMFLTVINNEDGNIFAVENTGHLGGYVFKVRDGRAYPPEKNMEIYLTPERRKMSLYYDEERREKDLFFN